jgi:ATP-binding cassette subfamily A (ABC1) protein 1
MLITIFLLVITMKYGQILLHSDPLIVIIFLVVFMISTIMMCFLISVFFSRANVAAACGGIIFFVTYLPYSLVRWYESFMTTSQKAVSVSCSTGSPSSAFDGCSLGAAWLF